MKRIKCMGRAVPIAAIALLLSLAALGAASDSLPGGSSISVTITSPATNAVVPEGPVTVTGTASVGQGVPVPNTVLVYVIDLSGSTQTLVPGTLCGAQNADAPSNQIIDCEIAAAKALNNAAIGAGTVFDIATVGFGGLGDGNLNSAFVMDLGPASGSQQLVPPNSNTNGGALDLDEALFRVADGGQIQLFTPANVGPATNYWAAVQRAAQIAKLSTATNKIVVFLSDGLSNQGGPSGQNVNSVLTPAIVGGITFHTFAIGNLAACSTSQANRGTLQQIADATGGTCTEISDPQDTIDVLPAVIGSSLTGVSVSVNGGPVSPAATTPALPLTGPGNAAWEFTTGALTPGTHQICGTATGSDGGGNGSVNECVTVRVNAPPSCASVVASPGSMWPPNNKFTPVTLSGGSDPEGDSFSIAVTGVQQDEPASASGDASLAGGNAVNLRAARLGAGDGRIYEIAFTVTDQYGATCSGTTKVVVPHDQSGAPAIDSVVRFSSLP